MRTAAVVKGACLAAAQKVAQVLQDGATLRNAMRKLGPDEYCQLERCIRNQPYDPNKHKGCVEWVILTLDPRSGPPD